MEANQNAEAVNGMLESAKHEDDNGETIFADEEAGYIIEECSTEQLFGWLAANDLLDANALTGHRTISEVVEDVAYFELSDSIQEWN